MRKYMLCYILMGSLVSGLVCAAKIIPLPDLLKPKTFAVDNNQLYIADGTSICIYSLTDFTLKKKFGRQGEGPQEFKEKIYLVDLRQDYILVNSVGKVSFFTTAGEFIKEMKTPLLHRRFRPLGKKFTGARALVENKVMYNAINIYDANLKKEKEIARLEHEVQPKKGTKAFARALSADTFENKLVIAGKKDFVIDVFDENGNELYSIKRKYEKVNVTDRDKENVIHFLKTDPDTKEYFELLKPVTFPREYPAVKEVIAADKKIYVMTWKRENGNVEFFIFNIDGKFVKKIFLPLQYMNPVDVYPLAIKNGTLYQLVDNLDTEEWELHITEIK